jgi:hypothetical protein
MKELPQDKFLKERMERIAHWREQLAIIANAAMRLQVDLEKADAELKALVTRAGIRPVK